MRTYRLEFTQLLQALGKFPVQDLQPEQLRRYLLYCIGNGLKENSVQQVECALPRWIKKIKDVLLCLCVIE